MTCQFYYVTTRPFCALGEPDGRHCGPRQYPPGPCNLDEIGRGDAWRGTVMPDDIVRDWAAILEWSP